jgi:hypothetical protein
MNDHLDLRFNLLNVRGRYKERLKRSVRALSSGLILTPQGVLSV